MRFSKLKTIIIRVKTNINIKRGVKMHLSLYFSREERVYFGQHNSSGESYFQFRGNDKQIDIRYDKKLQIGGDVKTQIPF